MPDREMIVKWFEFCRVEDKCSTDCPYWDNVSAIECTEDVITLLKEQESFLGIQQTADSITFISTGTAQQGEARGLLLGKLAMHEWLEKELLYRGLLTDDIRAVFDEAKRQ